MVGVLPTHDAERAGRFFAGTLGLELLEREDSARVFRAGGALLRLVQLDDVQPRSSTALGWEVADMQACVDDLRGSGVEFVRYEGLDQDERGVWTAPNGDRVAWLKDPDENLLSISQRVRAADSPLGEPSPEEVLRFWFGEIGPEGLAAAQQVARWWKKDPGFDDEIRRRFALPFARAVSGQLDHWRRTARGRLALILLLDQFSRNMFRGSGAMFAGDPLALRLAVDGIDRGDDRQLAVIERVFCYMPLMHSERLEHQERCVGLFRTLRSELTGTARESVSGNLDFALRHRDIVARFGRFPHRNTLVERESTPEELEFLEQPGSSF